MSNENQTEKKPPIAASADALKRALAEQMANEEYGEALETVAAMVKADIHDADAFCDAAYSYFMRGDYERATAWVDTTLRFAPNHIKARILLARICLLEGRTTDGFSIFEFLLENFENVFSTQERENIEEILTYHVATRADEIKTSYPAIARFLQLECADQKQQTAFQPLAQQVQHVKAQTVQPASTQPLADDAAEALRLVQDVLSKDIALLEKVRLLNYFAGGFFLAGSFLAAKTLLKQALVLDARDAMTLSNMSYTLVALGDRDTALALASKMPLPDFRLLAAIRG